MARIFLYVVAAVSVLVIAGLILLSLFWDEAQQFALSRTVPTRPFESVDPPAPPDYSDPTAWAARPEFMSLAKSTPAGVASIAAIPEADVFFIHPTTYGIQPAEHGGRDALLWNGPIGDPVSRQRTEVTILKNQASAFNLAGKIYAPHYRQATFGAFFTEDRDAMVSSLSIAYFDIARAFDHYLEADNNGRPFILASHSQGSVHALLLLKNKIAGTAAADRMVAAYVLGWPVSIEEDLAAIKDIGPCIERLDTGCVLTWQSFEDGGNPGSIIDAFNAQTGLSGQSKSGSRMLCVNPLNGARTTAAVPRTANRGAVPFADLNDALGTPIPGLVGAKCGDDGILYLQPAPAESFNEYVLIGGNYHVYDINLFYMNLRADAAARTNQFLSIHRADDSGGTGS